MPLIKTVKVKTTLGNKELLKKKFKANIKKFLNEMNVPDEVYGEAFHEAISSGRCGFTKDGFAASKDFIINASPDIEGILSAALECQPDEVADYFDEKTMEVLAAVVMLSFTTGCLAMAARHGIKFDKCSEDEEFELVETRDDDEGDE